MEIGVGEEEEGDFELRVFGREMEEFGGVVGVGRGLGEGVFEEADVIELVGRGNGDAVGPRGEDAGGEEEEDWEREEERESEDEWGREH